MNLFPLYPVFFIDMIGAALTIAFTVSSLILSYRLLHMDRENIIWLYMVWLSGSFTVFAFSRGIGHIIRYGLAVAGYEHLWDAYLLPITGSINTLSFVFAGTVSLFFIGVSSIYEKMASDKKHMTDLNRELTDLNAELEDIASERSLNLMALRVADKVRNPATIIGAIVLRLFNTPDLSEPVRKKLMDVKEASGRLDLIVKEYEDILRSKEKFFKIEDLNEILKDILAGLESRIDEKDLRVSMELSKKAVPFYAVKHVIKIAFVHLVRNAIEVSPRRGAIVIRSGALDKRVFASVSDEGKGIARQDIDRIFDLFYSTKGHLGTGLPIVKQIVEEHGGEIKVESAAGKGTTFYVYFPAGWLEFAASPSKKG